MAFWTKISLACCAMVLVLASAFTARAQSTAWTNTASGNWSVAGNWNPNVVPGSGTNVFLTNNVASSYIATNDVLNNTIANLTIFNRSTGTNTLLNGASGFNPTGNVIVGSRGIWDLNGFSATVGGSLIVSNLGRVLVAGPILTVATNTGSAFFLSGASVIITNGGALMVGSSGQGSISNSGAIRIGSGGMIIAGVITNRGVITTLFAGGGNAVITGSVLNLTATTTFGSAGLNVAGGASDSTLSLLGLHPFLNDVNNGSITIASNGTLNVGGTTAGTATASFTNRGTITIIGGAQVDSRINTINAGMIVNDTNGAITMFNSSTLAGLTNFVNADVLNKGTFTFNSSGPGNRYVRSLTNSGVVNIGGLAGAVTTIQQGSLVNDGRVDTGIGQDLVISNGGLINSPGGKVLFNRTDLFANFFVQDGQLSITNTGIISRLLLTDGTTRMSFTNNGSMNWFTADLSGDAATLVASNILNRGSLLITGKTNITAQGIPSTQGTWLDGHMSNDVSGVISVRTNALAAFDRTLINLGTINIESNSVLSMGHSGIGANQVAARGSPTNGTASFQGGLNGWTNDGTVNMEVGSFLSVRSLTNSLTGLISGGGHIGPIFFRTITNLAGSITQYVRNVTVANIVNAGRIEPNGTLNAGAITNLSGGSIIGSGVIQSINVTNFFSGSTLVTSNIYTGARILNNAGATVLASGGTLVLSNGFVNNTQSGTIGATNGGRLVIDGGTQVLTNNGTIRLTGGELVNGSIVGPGNITMSTGTNALTIAGSITVANGSSLSASNTVATVSGIVTNLGVIRTANAQITFSNGVFVSALGTVDGSPGDTFEFKNNFLIQSANAATFDLASSTVSFSGDVGHTNAVTGLDLGATTEAPFVAGNFAYGELQIVSTSDHIYFTNQVGAIATTALYAHEVDLLGDTNNVANLHSPFNIYYAYSGLEPNNAYLNDQTYGLDGGGFLIPVIPEPSTLLLAFAAAALLLRRRRW